MSEGELLQLQKARKLNISEDVYFRIIKSKTAALLSACTACGAKSATDDPATVARMKELGEMTGMAFQIRDDILDYEGTGLTGKATGNDIKEKKITLPLIHALEKASFSERRRILSIVRSRKKSRSQIDEVIRFVAGSGGIEYAVGKMNMFRDQALQILYAYPPSDVRDSLAEFVNYTTSRKK
jgi:octaprenyl-diphosphate synthase